MNEPSIDPARVADLQFRTRASSSTTAGRSPTEGLWWQIALGVFLALMAHSVVTGLYTRYEIYRAMQQLDAETKKAAAQLNQTLRAVPSTPNTGYNYTPAPAPLRDGERCINGRRFSRVANGWRQINEPC